MKNGIIINGVEYKVVRHAYFGFPVEDAPCNKCGLYKKCFKEDIQPCRLFNYGHYLAYFKKLPWTLKNT